MQTTARTGSRINPRLATAPSQSVLMRLLDAFNRWEETKRQQRKLSEMPQHRLDDMGLTRSDIDRAFR